MATFVTDIDLAAPLPTITLPYGMSHALLLVRRHHRSLGLVHLSAPGAVLTPERIQAAIEAELPAPSPVIGPPRPARPISIIVCTHERPDDLHRCLEALRPLARAGHEILVVDNAPRTTRAAELVSRYPYRYLHEPRPGLNHARNRGVVEANHEIVAFADDDTVPDPQWANALVEPFEAPDVGGVTGLVMPWELVTPAQELFELYCLHRRAFSRQRFRAPALPPAAAGVAGMGANMAFRRGLLLHLGLFDPRLDAGTLTCSGGDTDLFARLLEGGSSLVYTPDALVWHRHRREEEALRQCLFGYGVGLFSFLTKRLVEARDARALEIAARWFAGPFVKAGWRRLRGQPAVPLPLLLQEGAGALAGPWRFYRESARSRHASR